MSRLSATEIPDELSGQLNGLTVRRAKTDDAYFIAELFNYAGEGLPYYLWAKLAKPGDDPWDIGRSRAAREAGGYSYRNGIIAQLGWATRKSPTAQWPEKRGKPKVVKEKTYELHFRRNLYINS